MRTANLHIRKRSYHLHVSSRSDHISLAQKRRRRSLARGRLTLFMGLFGVAFILLTFGYIAWEQRNRLIQRNEDDLRNAAFFLADHTARLLEVTDLTLKQTIGPGAGTQSWDEVETSRPLWQQIHAIQEALPYIEDIWLNDPSGRLRLTSAQFPPPAANVVRIAMSSARRRARIRACSSASRSSGGSRRSRPS